MNLRPITAKDYKFILELDKKVYPTKSPVTSKILAQWYSKNPEFGLIYEEDRKIVGVCIAIPLNRQGWIKLINGEISESDIDGRYLSDSKETGIHIYHLEKIDPNIKEFYKICLKDISSLADKNKMNIIGISALSVAKCGINLFSNKLGFKEKNFISLEHILEKNGKKIVIDSQKDIKKYEKKGYQYLNRCQMLVLSREDSSFVWNIFN